MIQYFAKMTAARVAAPGEESRDGDRDSDVLGSFGKIGYLRDRRDRRHDTTATRSRRLRGADPQPRAARAPQREPTGSTTPSRR